LLGRASTVISFKEYAGGLKFVLEDHPRIKPFTVDLPSNPVTMDMFIEA
jgi:hypothetical protein